MQYFFGAIIPLLFSPIVEVQMTTIDVKENIAEKKIESSVSILFSALL